MVTGFKSKICLLHRPRGRRGYTTPGHVVGHTSASFSCARTRDVARDDEALVLVRSRGARQTRCVDTTITEEKCTAQQEKQVGSMEAAEVEAATNMKKATFEMKRAARHFMECQNVGSKNQVYAWLLALARVMVYRLPSRQTTSTKSSGRGNGAFLQKPVTTNEASHGQRHCERRGLHTDHGHHSNQSSNGSRGSRVSESWFTVK